MTTARSRTENDGPLTPIEYKDTLDALRVVGKAVEKLKVVYPRSTLPDLFWRLSLFIEEHG